MLTVGMQSYILAARREMMLATVLCDIMAR